MAKKPLSSVAARNDLTDREVTKIIGGMLGGLLDMADLDQIKNAVQWWAETPEAWAGFEAVKQAQQEMLAEARKEGKTH